MRFVKILGLTTGLAMVATALIGISPSAAVTMCMTEGNASKECPTGKAYLAREYKAQLETDTVAILQGEGYNTLCEESTVTAKTTKKEGNPLPGEVLGITLGACEGCKTAKALNLPYGLNMTSTGDGKKDGDLKVIKSGGPPRIELTGCIGGLVTCIFGAASEKVDLEFEGGTTAKILAAIEPFQYVSGTSEAACKKNAKFTATYVLTEPTAAWVTAFP